MARGNLIGGKSSCKIADDESKRAPQPYRPIGSSARKKSLERVGLGKWHQWRGEKRGQRIGGQDRKGASLKANERGSGHACETFNDHQGPLRLASVRPSFSN